MKAHTNEFKNAIKMLGREIDSKITLNGEIIDSEHINSISLHYEGAILKSVMKQLDLDIDRDIPINSVLNAQFGVKVNGVYEYLNLGNFVVYKSEKQEDLSSYKITCYDKILYSMKEYETPKVNGTEITYPITIRNYLSAICSHLGLTFANSSDTFTNYDKEIPYELYLDSEGNSLNYTFRDVLDELAEVTASTICINENDELEIRYLKIVGDTTKVSGTSIYITDAIKQGFLYDGVNNITQTNSNLPFEMELEYITQSDFETIDEEFLKDINVNFGEKYGPINTVVLTRSEVDSISQSIPEDLADEDKKAIKIVDNQIMNFNDRDTYLTEILNRLYGLEYYINDFASTGICYLDLCDMYGVSIEDKVYKCLMLNDEINITQGLEENIFTEMPQQAEVEYKYTEPTDKAIREAGIIINKKISEVDIKGKTIKLTADDIDISSTNFNVDTDGNLKCNNADVSGKITGTSGEIGGYEIDKNDETGTKYLMASAFPEYDFTHDDWVKVNQYISGQGTLTPAEIKKYDINKDGSVTFDDLNDLTRILQLSINTTSGIYVQFSSNPNNLAENGIAMIAGNMTLFAVGPFYGVTINNGRALGYRVLYDNPSGSNGTITLVDQIDTDLGIEFYISQYSFLEIFGIDNNDRKGVYLKLTHLADGDNFVLSVNEAGTGTYIRRTKYTITNNNTLVPSNGGYVYITSSGSVQTNSSQNYIKITKVLGYK